MWFGVGGSLLVVGCGLFVGEIVAALIGVVIGWLSVVWCCVVILVGVCGLGRVVWVGPCKPILTRCWPSLGLCFPILVAMLAHLGSYVGPSWGYVGPAWEYLGPSWGLCCSMLRLCWSILKPVLAHVDPSRATRSEKWKKIGKSTKHRKTRGFLAGDSWPDLSVYAWQPARGPNYVGPSCGYVGLCWPIVRAIWTQLRAMLAYLEGYVGRSWGLCRPILKPILAHVDACWAKRSEKWEHQKTL